MCGGAAVASWSGRATKAVMPAAAVGAQCELQICNADGGCSPYAGDWAMYDGYVEETGRTEVDVTVQSPPERITPSSPKRFARMYLHGAREGQSVTLSEECRLTPVFSPAPAEGSAIVAADIADHAISQAELLAALQQMFNLRFYTDHARKRVYVEPYDDFFRDDTHDWSDRVDLACDVETCDLAAEVHERRTLAYRAEGGGAVARFEAESGERLGEWSFDTPSQIALRGERRMVNPLFCATLDAAGVYSSAPSASSPSSSTRPCAWYVTKGCAPCPRANAGAIPPTARATPRRRSTARERSRSPSVSRIATAPRGCTAVTTHSGAPRGSVRRWASRWPWIPTS